jgi:hypothetical protein
LELGRLELAQLEMAQSELAQLEMARSKSAPFELDRLELAPLELAPSCAGLTVRAPKSSYLAEQAQAPDLLGV